MLQPSQTSSEDGHSTDSDTGDPVPAIAEIETRAQHMESASLLDGSNAELLKFFDDLSEQEWTIFSLEMHNPETKEEFLKTCTNIARVVRLTSLNIVMPALYQMVDLQSPVLKSQAASRPSSGSSRSSRCSISFIEDGVDVMIMKNGMLSKTIPKRSSSRTSARSSRSSLSPPKGQRSPLHGSQTSLVDSKSTPLCDELETTFDLTKESVCLSVIQSLGNTLIDLQSQSLSPDLKDLSTNVVKEVVVSVFRALKTFGHEDVTVQETKDLFQKVSKELSESFAKKDAAKSLVLPVEDETLEPTLASTVEETMNVVLQTLEDCLDDGEESKPAKNILANIRKVARMLACRTVSLEELKADAITDNRSPSSEQICVSQKTLVLFNDEFHSKATLAVSFVLRARGIHSSFAMNSCLSSSASPVCSVSGNKPAASSRSAPALLPPLPKSDSPSGVETPESAEKVMSENFSDSEPRQILQSAASDLVGHFVDGVQKCEMELSTLKMLSKAKMISATAGLYQSMQKRVRQMFAQRNFMGRSADVGAALEDASAASGLAHSDAVSRMSQHDNAVDPEASQQVEAVTDAQCLSPDADECTKDIMTEILTVYKEQLAEENCSDARCSVTSFLGTQLIDDIMSSLGEETLSRPSTCIQENVVEEDADLILPIKRVISSENFEMVATAKVSEVLLKSTGSSHDALESEYSKLCQDLQTTIVLSESVDSNDSKLAQESLPTTALSAKAIASDIVNTVVRDIEKLFHLRPSEDEADEAISILQEIRRAELTVSVPLNDKVQEIWRSGQNMLKALQSRVKDFYHEHRPSHMRNMQKAEAKKAISKVLVSLQEKLPKLPDFESSGELKLMWDIVHSMIGHVEEMEDENEPGEQKGSSVEAERSKTPSSVSSIAGSGCIPVCPIVRRTYIDMSDTGSDHEPAACRTQNTAIQVAKVILNKLGFVKDNSASSTPCDHSTFPKSVERVLSSGSIRQYSPSLTDEVYCLLLEGNKSPEAMTLCAGKSVSDSILLKVGRSEGISRKDSTFQLIKAYSLESVKYLLLPLFHFSSLQSTSQDKLLQASASRSCPSVLRRMTGEVPCQRASRSPSEILDVTVTLVSNIMECDTLAAPTLPAEMLENDFRPPSLNADHISLSASSTVLGQSLEGQDKITVTSVPLTPLASSNEDHTSLVTLLVIRLLSQVQGQRSFSDDMLDMSRRLIDKVLDDLNAAPGTSQTDTSSQVKIQKAYKAIYSDLVKEFGSENLVSKAMETPDSSFEKIVIASLRNELMGTQTSVEPVLCPATNEDAIKQERKLPRQGIFRLLPKMPKINLKKFKISVKKNNHASNKGKAPATASSNTVSGSSSEEKPRRRNLFIRMFSALTRKSS